MNQKKTNENVNRLMEKFDEINTYYIEKVAAQIALIGELNPSSMNIISIFASMNEDINEINAKLALATRQTIPQLYSMYERALNDVYYDRRFERALKETPLPDSSKRALERYAEAISRQTAETMQNLSNTTAVSQTYRNAVDKAILAVSSGLGDYGSEMRKTLRQLGYNGMQTVYESGYHRRLDTALRQNIIDGVKQIQQHASDMIGEELGYDAFEISVHANSAPDHEPVQGHIFLKEEFEKLQNDLEAKDIDGVVFPAMARAIGEWNCYHFAMSFSTKYSKRKYTPEQLDEFKKQNAQTTVIDGKEYTKYEVTQLMRKIETEIRRQKDVGVAAQAGNDDTLRQEAQRKINALSYSYSQIANAAGLPQRRDRMTVEGFKPVKISKRS